MSTISIKSSHWRTRRLFQYAKRSLNEMFWFSEQKIKPWTETHHYPHILLLFHFSQVKLGQESSSDLLQATSEIPLLWRLCRWKELTTSYWAGNKRGKRIHLQTHEFWKTSSHIHGTLFGTRAICLPDVSDRNVSMNLDLAFFSPHFSCTVEPDVLVFQKQPHPSSSLQDWIIHACITSFLQQWAEGACLSTFSPLIFFLMLLQIKLKASTVSN